MPVQIGKLLIILGLGIALIGAVLAFGGRIPLLGRLPGDIHIRKDGVDIYLPITTSVLISVVLSLVAWLLSRGR